MYFIPFIISVINIPAGFSLCSRSLVCFNNKLIDLPQSTRINIVVFIDIQTDNVNILHIFPVVLVISKKVLFLDILVAL